VDDELILVAGAILDHEGQPQLHVIVIVADPDLPGFSQSQTLFINVTDVNEAPVVTLENADITAIPESYSLSARLRVADIVVADDALGTNVLSLEGDDASWFEIVGTALFLKATAILDYE